MGLKNLLSNLGGGKPINPSDSPSYPYHNDFGNDKSISIFDNSTFNQKSIGFEDEEPFIKGGINLGGTSTFNSITGGFIRGGALMYAERSLQDTTRIGKFFVSSRGITFLAKQVALQKANPKISEPSFSKSPANHRTYNFGINTLAQVAGQGTGLHVNRQGVTPLSKVGYADEKRFRDIDDETATGKDKITGQYNNRLLYLYDNHITRPKPKTPKTGFFQKIKNFFAKPGEELYSYQGGPGSTYGIGQTKIQKYSLTPAFEDLGITQDSINISTEKTGIIPDFIISKDTIKYFTLGNTKDVEKDFEDLAKRDKNFNTTRDQHSLFDNPALEAKGESHKLQGRSRVKNYLKTLGKKGATNYNKKREDGKTFHREERIGLGNPGADPNNTLFANNTVDLLNALDIFKSDGGDLSSDSLKDLVRFRIEAINPENILETNVMVFRAFLDSMNDNFNANYNEFNYNGRGESFYTYNSFNRSIDFSFKIAAQSSKEMRPLYRKLNYLLSNTAPEYNTTSGRMMTPFMRLTIGAYFNRLPGVITNVGITWQKDYPWEIVLDENEGNVQMDKKLFVLPHVLDVNISYQPIHDFLPQKSEHSPFIIPHEGSAIARSSSDRQLWNSEKIPTLKAATAKTVNSSL